jgi:signal transduction histidine kinase
MADVDNPSHAFKNQLTVIRGFSEILIAETPAEDPRRRDLEEIHKAAMTALELLARLYPAGGSTRK